MKIVINCRHMKRVLLAGLLLLFAGTAFPQISGRVTDRQKKPVPYATVLLYDKEITGGTPKAYAITDDDGRFRVGSFKPAKGSWVVVRSVGFKELRRELDPKQHLYNFVMEVDIKSLKEVKVKSDFYGISENGDTVKFSTDYFKNGTEETAGELLDKIPGVEVDGGSVTYAGKKVDKVLLDGRELFSDNGGVLLDNLPAELVKGAELLTNYKGNSLTEEFKDQAQTALNIKTDQKSQTSGKIRLSGGLTNAYDANGYLLHTSGKWAVSANLSANNLDAPVASGAMVFYNLDNSLSAGEGYNLSTAESDLMNLSFLPSDVYQADKGMLSLDVTYYPSEKFKVNSRFTGSASLMRSEIFSEQVYAATAETNHHSKEHENRSRLLNGSVKVFYQPDKQWEFSALTQLSYSGSLSDYRQSDYGFVRKLGIFSNDTADRFSFGEELVCHRKIGKGLLSPHISFRMTNQAEENQWWTDSALLPVAYLRSGDSLGLHLGIENLKRSFKSDVTYSYPISKHLKFKSTVTWERGRNDYRYQELEHYMEENVCSAHISLGNRNGKLHYSLRMSAVADRWQTDIREMEKGFTPYLTASAYLSLNFKPTHSLDFTATNNQTPIGLTTLLRDTIINSYQSMHGGSRITDPFSKYANIRMNYRVRNNNSGTGFYANAYYMHGQCMTTTNYTQNGLMSITVYDNKGESENISIRMSVSQSLKFIPVEARLSGSSGHSFRDGTVNGDMVRTVSGRYTGKLSLVSRSKGRFNGEISGNIGLTDNKVTTLNNRLQEIGGKASCSYADDHWRASLNAGYSQLMNRLDDMDLWDLGFSVSYRFKHWEIWLQGSNLFNLNETEWMEVSMNPVYTSTTIYRKIPGSLLLGLAYRIAGSGSESSPTIIIR